VSLRPQVDAATEATRFVRDFVNERAFLARYPYYAAVLARMEVVVDPTVSSMGVSLHGRRFYLHVNPEYFVAQPKYLRGILLHEVHHVVLGHLTNPRLCEVLHDDLMEIAKEVSANEYIEEALPDPIVWKQFERYGLRPGQSTRERYDRLVAAREAQPAGWKPEPRFVDDHDPQKRGGRGREVPGVDPAQGLVEDAIRAARDAEEDEQEGGDPRRGLLAGKLPGRILEELGGVVQAPAVAFDWKTALAMFVAARRAPAHRWGRPNRRFPGRIGEVPGRVYAARTIARPRLLVALDTSLSMPDEVLAEVARQLRQVAEHADLVVAEIDTEVAHVGPFDGLLTTIHGRGGTDLRPAFEPAFLGAHDVAGVIYFTDGDGPFPESPPPVPTLWVLTKDEGFACPWGARVVLDVEGTLRAAAAMKRRR
jgi:predicted metal-dependent peptidase